MSLQFLPTDLYSRLGTAAAPLLIDVRTAQAFEADDRLIIGALRHAPDDVEPVAERLTERASSRRLLRARA